MSSNTQFVEDLVRSETRRVALSWRPPERRAGLLEICRAIDTIVVSARHQKDDVVEFCRQGADKAISLFMDDSCRQRRAPIFPSDDRTIQWAFSVLQHCGRIASCEKLLDYERAGLGRFFHNNGELQFEYTPKYVGLEAIENDESKWILDEVADTQEPALNLLDSAQPGIHERMKKLVYCWADHFIGYNTAPEIDEFFDQRGLLSSERMFGYDVFADDAVFGGRPFSFYREGVRTLVGWAIKHLHFAAVLQRLRPDLRIQNLVTITADIDRVTSELACALHATEKDASKVLSLLEVNLDNATQLLINGHAPPPLLRVSSEQVLRVVSGFLIEPLQVMLRNLRTQYQNDWDRAVNDRESRFRDELLQLFPQDWLVKFPTGISFKKAAQKLTDVDAVVLDKKTGVVGLFQLKWQDAFGHSMRERGAKMKNFSREAQKWIDTVGTFLANATPAEMCQMLGLSIQSRRPLQYRLFVIGRYFAHFSGDATPDDRAAWIVWPQLIRLAKKVAASDNPIEELYSAGIADSPINRPVSVPASTFRLGDITITMQAVG